MKNQAKVFISFWVCLILLGGLLALTPTPAPTDVSTSSTHEPKGQGSGQKSTKDNNSQKEKPNPGKKNKSTSSSKSTDPASSASSTPAVVLTDTTSGAIQPSGGHGGVTVTGPAATEPVCMTYLGYPVDLDNHDYVLLSCNLRKNVQILVLGSDSLPMALPQEMNYVSGMRLSLGKNSNPLQMVLGFIQVNFKIPAIYVDASRLMILEWTGTKWKEVSGTRATTVGYMTAPVKHVGMFVLVQK